MSILSDDIQVLPRVQETILFITPEYNLPKNFPKDRFGPLKENIAEIWARVAINALTIEDLMTPNKFKDWCEHFYGSNNYLITICKRGACVVLTICVNHLKKSTYFPLVTYVIDPKYDDWHWWWAVLKYWEENCNGNLCVFRTEIRKHYKDCFIHKLS